MKVTYKMYDLKRNQAIGKKVTIDIDDIHLNVIKNPQEREQYITQCIFDHKESRFGIIIKGSKDQEE